MTRFDSHNSDMNKVLFRLRPAVLLVFTSLVASTSASEVNTTRLPSTPPLHDRYRLDIKLLLGGNPAARINTTRDWSAAFQRMGQRVKIIPDSRSETPEIRNDKYSVHLTGLIDQKGDVCFDDKTFRRSDVASLEKFLTSLEEHGAGGPIRQRSTWGLSEEQYAEVLKLLSSKVSRDLTLSSSVAADVESMKLPEQLHVTWSDKAKQIALSNHDGVPLPGLTDLSQGTALAIALAQRGLGFRVMSHPQRGYFLEIDAGNEASNLWPVGWKNTRSMSALLPVMYRSVDVDLDDVSVELVMTDVAGRAGIGWLTSRYQLTKDGIRFEDLKTSRRPGRISPHRLLQSIGAKNRFRVDVRTDESGTLFLWCTTVADQKAWKQRFAQVIRGRAAD